jgi:hypothetical protein
MAKRNQEITNHETPGLPEGGEGGGESVREASSSLPPEGTTGTQTSRANKGGRPPGSRNRTAPTKNAAPRKAASKLPPNSTGTGTGMISGIEQVSPLLVNFGACIAGLKNYGLTEAQILSSVREAF